MITPSPAEPLIPRMRGRLHVYAFWGALFAASALVALAPSGTARTACAIYGTALCALFAVSALYHRWRWNPRWRPLLRRLDHSTIHIFIAASTTPLAVLILDGRLQAFVLACAWAGALGGIALSLAWIDAPRALVAASYVLVGWAALAALPQPPRTALDRAAAAARRRRRALHRRGRRLRHATPESLAGGLRLPRGLPRTRGPGRDQPLPRLRGLDRAQRLSVLAPGAAVARGRREPAAQVRREGVGLAPRVAQEVLVVAAEQSALLEIVEQPAEDLARHGTRDDRSENGSARGDECAESVTAVPCLAERNEAAVLSRLFA